MTLPINQIVCGDCLEIMRGWPDGCVDLVLTDPPYGIGFQSNSAINPRYDILANDNDNFDIWTYWEEAWSLLKETGAGSVFCRWDVANRWSQFIKPDNQIIIPRGRCNMGGLDNFSFWDWPKHLSDSYQFFPTLYFRPPPSHTAGRSKPNPRTHQASLS